MSTSLRGVQFSLEFSKNHLTVSVILSLVHLFAFPLISTLILYFLSHLSGFFPFFLIIHILSPIHKHGPFLLLYKFGGFMLPLVLWWTDELLGGEAVRQMPCLSPWNGSCSFLLPPLPALGRVPTPSCLDCRNRCLLSACDLSSLTASFTWSSVFFLKAQIQSGFFPAHLSLQSWSDKVQIIWYDI